MSTARSGFGSSRAGTPSYSTYSRNARPSSSASRPRSGASRPSTSRPGTGVSTSGVAREIGMAALDKDTGQCVLFQIPDCQTYVKTLHHLRLHNPSSILIPDTFMPMDITPDRKLSLLMESMKDEFGEEDGFTEFVPISRKYWNDQNGLEDINQFIIDDGEKAGTLVAVSNKYYALSAAAALFKFVETRMNTTFAPHSLRISFRCAEGTMMIDCETARNLELAQSNLDRRSKYSLFGLLNHTFTPMAHRLLRINILAPITDQNAINHRLDVVQELVNDEEKYTAIRDALKTLKKVDLDKLIAQLTTSENRPVGGVSGNAKGASARVDQIITLRNVVRSLPGVVKALQGCRSSLLCMIANMLDDERVRSIDEMVSQGLNDDALAVGGGGAFGGGFGAITKKVYAVKANYNRLLDVARETYRENVTDIMELQSDLSKEHDLPLALQYQDNGFVFFLKKGDTPEGGKLPAPFINLSAKKNGRWTFSHLELKKRNTRLRDSLDEALILSDKIVKALVERILVDVGVLYKASEAIGLMDMLWAFAHTSILHNYTRPEFTGTLAIKAGRHPVLENIQAGGNFVPNDTYACDGSSFQIVEGPNMSGKSTYLRQVGTLAVLAMCGCFVPAEYASFRIHDALLTRLSNDDDPERSLSTFAKEMMTSSMILSVATASSLILIDELGRGTSPVEGVGLAHAIAEEIINIKAYTFFTTHFHQLTQTLSKHPTVVNLHLAVEKSTRVDETTFRLRFRHLLVDGTSDTIDHYGLELARLADLPTDVLTNARTISTKLKAQDDAQQAASESNATAARRKILLRLRVQLQQALNHSALEDAELLHYLEGIQKDAIVALRELLPDVQRRPYVNGMDPPSSSHGTHSTGQ